MALELQDDISEVFPSIPYPSLFLYQRQSSQTTSVAGLITGLRNYLLSPSAPPVHPEIYHAVFGTHPRFRDMTIATTRTPEFNDRTYTHFSTGFRQLIPYNTLSCSPSAAIPSLEKFDARSDIPAVFGPGDATLDPFFKMWGAMGVVPDFHFILLFVINSRLDADIDLSFLDVPAPSEIFPSPPPLDFPNPPLLSSSLPLSPAPSSQLSSRPSSRNSHTAPYPTHKPQSASVGIVVLEGTCKTPFVCLIRNYYAMHSILTQLSLNLADRGSSRMFTLGNGQVIAITAEQVLDYFKWKYSTFNNKRALYRKAKNLAMRTWSSNIPDDSNPALLNIYHVYLAIKFLWAEHGPLDLNNSPILSADAAGDEKWAAGLNKLVTCDAILKHTQ
ncbi:hypothetical protein GGX14DRAFT_579684 [Mycena pura]|uniref:Uncharacterized protein n=1 Tax=Mycena pura TaxID=153505 RepID=A0AAD6URC2_9AGAR|nr:hypothetical protein GGX14DRAFT_579684 [Mycena pura]